MEKKALYDYGITLSGGGARGVFHVGALKVLEENGIIPGCLSGTSAGSIAAVLYAYGLSTEDCLKFVKGSQLMKFFKLGFPGGGLTKIDYLRERLQEVLPKDITFEELPKPVFVTGTNMNKGKTEIFSSGSVIDAVCISCAIPFFFEPVPHNGQMYLDGGIFMNLPTKPIRPLCNFLIGVNMHPIHDAENKELTTFKGIAERILDFTIWSNERVDAKRCDLLIEPNKQISNYRAFSISKADEIFNLGVETTIEALKTKKIVP